MLTILMSGQTLVDEEAAALTILPMSDGPPAAPWDGGRPMLKPTCTVRSRSQLPAPNRYTVDYLDSHIWWALPQLEGT
jgi:hypothetical protein